MSVVDADAFVAERVGIPGKVTGADIKAYVQADGAFAERITAATLATRVSGSSLVAGAIYQITDAPFLAVATATDAYDTYRRIAVGTTAPASPVTDDLWVDTT